MAEEAAPHRRPRRRRLARLGVELLILLALLTALQLYLTRDAVRGIAPPIETTLSDGRPFSLQRLRGRPALVYFWADWCRVCAAARGSMDGLIADYPAVTVALQSGGTARVNRYLAEHGLHWPAVADPDGRLARRYGVNGVPTVFVLDAGGRVTHVSRGFPLAPVLRGWLWLAGLPHQK